MVQRPWNPPSRWRCAATSCWGRLAGSRTARLRTGYNSTGTPSSCGGGRGRPRVATQGIDAVGEIAAGRGRKPVHDQAKRDTLIKATLQTRPKGVTHWSCRTMARAQGVGRNTVNRLWQLHNLKPHLHRTFKLSRDPKFLEKLTDVVGLYLNPPHKAVVLCVDEKSQIQALDRTQPGLPLKKGRCGTYTHDYKRNGTTTLFSALD